MEGNRVGGAAAGGDALTPTPSDSLALGQGGATSALRRIVREGSGLFGLIAVGLIVLVAIFAPVVATHDPEAIDTLQRFADPSSEHLMGTDSLGRDNFSRIVYGARIALIAALPSIALGALLGLVLGITAGYFSPGPIDNFLLILFDTVRSFPALLLAIALIAMTGPSLTVLISIIAVTQFPTYARLIRAQTLRTKEEDYVTAGRALGGSTPRIMFRHIFPNVVAPLFIQAAMDIPVVITFEAGLSFLGLGVPPPTPSWGAILREGYLYVRLTPWMIVFSGVTLIVATIGFTFLAEALRDVFDARLKGSGGTDE